MKAKDPVQYREAWQHHIDQLASLALAADIDYDTFINTKRTLEDWLDEAHAKFTRNHINEE